MSSRMEQIIEEIEEYIDSCKPQTLSKTNIIVNKEEIEELLRELRMKTPDEIKRYQKILANKDAILADAQAKAEQIIQAANVHTTELVNEHEIMQQAYIQANEIVQEAANQAQQIIDNATIDANNIRMGAMQYADDMLGNLQGIVQHAMDSASAKYDTLLNSLNSVYVTVNSNRRELAPAVHPEQATEEDEAEA